MNFILKSSYASIGSRPIHHWTLSRLLNNFGVSRFADPVYYTPPVQRERRQYRTRWVRVQRYQARQKYRCKRIERNLWDLWDVVRARWRALSRKLHPDVSGGDGSQFATMCRIYITIKQRFQNLGI